MKRFVSLLIVLTVAFTDLFSMTAVLIVSAAVITLNIRHRSGVVAVDRSLLLVFTAFLTLGSILVIYNAVLFSDLSPVTYWIAGFIVWYLFIETIRSTNDPGSTVHQAYVVLALMTGLGNLLYIVLFITNVITEPITLPGYQAYFGIDERGFFAFSTSLLPIVGALAPYFYYRAAHSAAPLIERVALVLLTLTGLASLRSIIWIIILGSMLYFAFRQFGLRRLLLVALASVGVLIAALLLMGVDRDIIEGIYQLKWAEKVDGDDVRYLQWQFWFDSFLQSPLIGHGLSSANLELYNIATGELLLQRPGPVVSEYGYEILYGKWLSDMGLFLLAYVALFTRATFIAPARSSFPWQVTALRASALCMVLQSATNSYLQTSGYLFALMLPMAFIQSAKPHEQR